MFFALSVLVELIVLLLHVNGKSIIDLKFVFDWAFFRLEQGFLVLKRKRRLLAVVCRHLWSKHGIECLLGLLLELELMLLG